MSEVSLDRKNLSSLDLSELLTLHQRYNNQLDYVEIRGGCFSLEDRKTIKKYLNEILWEINSHVERQCNEIREKVKREEELSCSKWMHR